MTDSFDTESPIGFDTIPLPPAIRQKTDEEVVRAIVVATILALDGFCVDEDLPENAVDNITTALLKPSPLTTQQTHTWHVRIGQSRVWHTAALPVGGQHERQSGSPDTFVARTTCGLYVDRFNHWSYGPHYYGGEPLQICAHCMARLKELTDQ